MSLAEGPCYTIINSPETEQFNEMQLKQDLEKGDINLKIETLKKVIQLMLNGERLPGLLMTIIRFVLPLQNHTIKKLLLIFWEIVPKTSPDGKLLQEMILVCDAYRKDLQHPNEFLRGSTLRFLCKLKEPELLEPLMPAIRACLDHRHSYVRRNAVLAIFTIFKNFEWLVPDGPELIANFLDTQQDMSCKRNAFLMLLHADQERALNYLASCLDQVNNFGDILQLVIVELIYKVCHANPTERSRFIRCIYNLLNSSSNAVRYEAAGTLITLSSAPTAIKAAAGCYIELIVKESDNNVKLIVLDRLIAMKENENMERVMQDLVMDILRVLAAPDIEVRRKTLALAMDLVSSRNIEEMVLVLKKEVSKTHNIEHEDTGKYRQLLVRTLHSCSIKFPDVAATVIPVLVDFLSDNNELAATDVLIFIREAIQKFPSLRNLIVEKLIEAFPAIKSSKVHRAAVWILGEYVESSGQILEVMEVINQTLGEIPMVEAEQKRLMGEQSTDEQIAGKENVAPNKVTSDGTYATQSAFSVAPVAKKEKRPPLRQYLMDGDFFIGAALAATLTKLALRYMDLDKDERNQNRVTAQAMLVMSSILHLGKSGFPTKAITNDDIERIFICLKTLSELEPDIVEVFKNRCRQALGHMLDAQHDEELQMQKEKQKVTAKVQPDDPVMFPQLSSGRDNQLGENVFESSLNQALAGTKSTNISEVASPNNKLNKVTQLTGFSDPVYAEAYVNVNQYDIVLDVLIVNQTRHTTETQPRREENPFSFKHFLNRDTTTTSSSTASSLGSSSNSNLQNNSNATTTSGVAHSNQQFKNSPNNNSNPINGETPESVDLPAGSIPDAIPTSKTSNTVANSSKPVAVPAPLAAPSSGAYQSSTGARPKVPQSILGGQPQPQLPLQSSSSISSLVGEGPKMKRSPRFSSFDSQASLAEFAGGAGTSVSGLNLKTSDNVIGSGLCDDNPGSSVNNFFPNGPDFDRQQYVHRSYSNYDMDGAQSVSPHRSRISPPGGLSSNNHPNSLNLNAPLGRHPGNRQPLLQRVITKIQLAHIYMVIVPFPNTLPLYLISCKTIGWTIAIVVWI